MRELMTALFVLFGLFVAPPSLAADLSGTWQLDRAASDSLDPFLEAQGVSWLKRTAAARMNVTLTITQSGDALTIETVMGSHTKTDKVEVDGETHAVEGERGTAQVRHEWKGDVLVTTSTMPMKDGEGTVVLHRSLSDGGKTLIQRVELTRPDGSKAKFDRIFRKT